MTLHVSTFRFLTLAILATFFVSGCASYKLGSNTENAPFSSISIAPVLNDSLAPQAAPIVTNALQQSLQTSGLSVVGEGSAEAVLEVRLVHYRRVATASRPEDTGRPGGFRVILEAQATLTGSNGTVYFKNRSFTGEVQVYALDDLASQEYAAMPQLSRSLADRIRDAVTGAW